VLRLKNNDTLQGKERGFLGPLLKEGKREMTIKNVGDFKLGVGFAVFCLFLLFFLIPNQVGSLTEADSFMPVTVTIFTLVVSVLLVIKSFGQANTSTEDHSHENKAPALSLWLVIAIMVVYAWLLEWTGFLLTSCIVMLVLFMVYGVKQYFRIILITLITLGLLYFSFEKLLYAPLPEGRLIEKFMF
jgi:hypothetical protein